MISCMRLAAAATAAAAAHVTNGIDVFFSFALLCTKQDFFSKIFCPEFVFLYAYYFFLVTFFRRAAIHLILTQLQLNCQLGYFYLYLPVQLGVNNAINTFASSFRAFPRPDLVRAASRAAIEPIRRFNGKLLLRRYALIRFDFRQSNKIVALLYYSQRNGFCSAQRRWPAAVSHINLHPIQPHLPFIILKPRIGSMQLTNQEE